MFDRLLGQPFVLEAMAGSTVQLWNDLGPCLVQAVAEKVAEEMVVAVPAALIVQWEHEKVGLFYVLQGTLTLGAFGHGIAQRGGEAVEDRRLE